MADETEDHTDQPEEDWLQDLSGSSGSEDSGLTVEHQSGVKATPPSPWGVKLDQWGKRRGEDLADADEFKKLGASAEDAADLYGMSFEMDPELEENCANPVKAEFLKALQENPDYQALHNETCLEVVASELASLKYTEQYTTFYKEREKQAQKKGKKGDGPPTPQEQLRRDMEAMAAANKAVQQAAQDVQDLRDMQEAMGIGKEDGGGGKINGAELKKTFLKLKNDQNLKAICELAGKYRMLARSKQRDKVIHGYDDMIGIVMDGDPGRMLSSELAKLAHPLFQLDAMRRFVERQMMCREYRAIQKVAKGPIMIGIDESGSMSGARIQNAKAMALAMAWVARHQNRWCGMFGWSSQNQIRMLALPPKKWPTAQVIDWLSKFLNGGTHIPIEKMPEIYDTLGAQRGKTDVIIITDGEAEQHAPDALQNFNKWKSEVSAKLIGITIAGESGALKTISDEYYRIASLSVDDEAVGKALSV
jgi:uncharacterized protein with von Willebrand factor type A (vWA) domain